MIIIVLHSYQLVIIHFCFFFIPAFSADKAELSVTVVSPGDSFKTYSNSFNASWYLPALNEPTPLLNTICLSCGI